METKRELVSVPCPPQSQQLVGRLAPSPTGALHVGNARSFLLAWLSIRSRGGRLLLRIEDIDSPRIKQWAVAQAIEDLRWLGLDWDATPVETSAASEPSGLVDAVIQSQRLDRYREVLSRLSELGVVYPCVCTRKDIEAAASAPHDDPNILDGPIYPGTCRGKFETTDLPEKYAWRWRFATGPSKWFDEIQGPQQATPSRQLGDFVVARQSLDAGLIPAYQLAVVVDDHDSGVNEVLRGDDLILSTYRQLAILDILGWPRPQYLHVPLVIGPDGRRLAKRHGDTRLSTLRQMGIKPSAIIGYLAWTLDIISEVRPLTSRQLLDIVKQYNATANRNIFDHLPGEPTVFDLATELEKLHAISKLG